MYVITGATGNTGNRIVTNLLAAGKTVKALARNPEKMAAIAEKGAAIVAGDLEDLEFLTENLRGATAAYIMLPPNFGAAVWRVWMREMVTKYVAAVQESGVKKVVLLSSMGAHRTEGVGPIGGLGELEIAFRNLPGVDVLALRPGYFMTNLYSSVGMIQHNGINGGVQKGDIRTPLVHPSDIADIASKRLLELDFTGFSVEFIAGPADLSPAEITAIIGKAIGKPELPYIEFSSADGKAGMMQAGLPETIAAGYVEMGEGSNKGYINEGYERSKAHIGSTTLQSFVEKELKVAIG